MGAGTGTKATALHRLSCPSDLLTIRQFVYKRRGWCQLYLQQLKLPPSSQCSVDHSTTGHSTTARQRAAKLQNASTLCCSHDELDICTLTQTGASGRQPCRVPSRILQLFTAPCSEFQYNSVKTHLSGCEAGSYLRTATNNWFCASRQHLSVTTFTCRPLDVTPPSFGGLRHKEVHHPSGSNAPSRWTSTMARGGREGAAPKDDAVEP